MAKVDPFGVINTLNAMPENSFGANLYGALKISTLVQPIPYETSYETESHNKHLLN